MRLRSSLGAFAVLLMLTALLLPGPANADETKLLAEGQSWTIEPNVGTVDVTLLAVSMKARITGTVFFKSTTDGSEKTVSLNTSFRPVIKVDKHYHYDGYVVSRIEFTTQQGHVQINAVYSD